MSDDPEDETHCHYVGSRGIYKSCNIYPRIPESSTRLMRNYPPLTEWKRGSVVYICITAVPYFLERALPYLSEPICIVSGDGDETFPNDVFRNPTHFAEVMGNPKILHWFSQNCAVRHPKVSSIPIGMDYHTMARGPSGWGPQTPCIIQEMELFNIRDRAPLFEARPLLCYSNHHFSVEGKRFSQDRIDAIRQIPRELMVYEPIPVSREQTWRNQSKLSFVISPYGNGMDCHRTWEALALGCIPVVRSGPLDCLYEGLPVLIVGAWSEINAELLERAKQDFANMVPCKSERLSLNYWMQVIYSRASSDNN